MFSTTLLRKPFVVKHIIIRSKHKSTHWSVLRKKVHPIDRALDHFDDFYKQVFTHNWTSMRAGLLGKQKYVAVVNNYGDNEETKKKLECEGALNMRTLFNLEKMYIQERFKDDKQVRYLQKIWKMEEAMNVKSQMNTTEKVEIEEVKNPYSLEEKLKKANMDFSRLIDESTNDVVSVMSQFLPATKIKGREDWIPESQYYRYYDKDTKIGINIEREHDFNFPEHLNVYCFEESNYSDFEHPKRGATGVYNYYLMDGGSVLPVLALDLKPGDKVLDMCASPGGKSYLSLQTLYPDYLVCNDISYSRVNKIFKVLNEYLYDLNDRWINTNRLRISNKDGRTICENNFNKIIIDVPCTTDRHSVIENENSIFRPGRIKERLQIPELQCALLVQALKLVSKGGVVVYSTCSLSPIQNDGVVYMALKQIWEETRIEFIVKDMSSALLQVRNVFKLADKKLMKYGSLIVPLIEQNYGPTYFCKLERIK